MDDGLRRTFRTILEFHLNTIGYAWVIQIKHQLEGRFRDEAIVVGFVPIGDGAASSNRMPMIKQGNKHGVAIVEGMDVQFFTEVRSIVNKKKRWRGGNWNDHLYTSPDGELGS